MTNIEEIVDSKELREQYISRTEVLDKVKKLFLIPQMEMMTIHQVAEFYEVELKAIDKCVARNLDEVCADGMMLKKPRDFCKIWKETKCRFPEVSKTPNSTTYQIAENVTVVIPNRGVRCFSKRAVLRIGMLLRDSKVAKEVRTQLLNVVEKVEETKPEILTEEIEREKELLNNVALAWASGDMMKFAGATMELNQYKDRHINQLKEANATLHKENTELTDQNKVLTDDNNILAGDILAWSNRASANKIVRLMAATLNWNFGSAWHEVYNELNYRYGINLTMRWTHDGKPKNKPYLSYLHDNEWDKLYKTVAAMLQKRYVNPSKIFAQAKLELKESDEKD